MTRIGQNRGYFNRLLDFRLSSGEIRHTYPAALGTAATKKRSIILGALGLITTRRPENE
jgi:hypothetical protein